MQNDIARRRIKTAARFAALAIPLLIGAGFYLIFDPHTAFSAQVYRLFPFFARPGVSAARIRNPVFRFCRNYLCDFCWAFSLEGSVILLLGCTRRGLLRSVGISFLSAVLLELLQKTKPVSGTFDPADILVETAAILSAGFIQYILGGKRK